MRRMQRFAVPLVSGIVRTVLTTCTIHRVDQTSELVLDKLPNVVRDENLDGDRRSVQPRKMMKNVEMWRLVDLSTPTAM